ncbi:MAG: M67 family metallopeptidase [Acidimicrobiia bacterium]
MSTEPDRLQIPAEMAAAVTAHASFSLPTEACGLVAVDQEGRPRMFYALTNEAPSPTSFTIAAAEQLGAVRHAERNRWDIGGVMHSHPSGPAVPSPTDARQPHDSNWFHLIVGFDPVPHLRAWTITDGMIRELDIVAVE